MNTNTAAAALRDFHGVRANLEAHGVPRVPTEEQAVLLTSSEIGTYLVSEIVSKAWALADANRRTHEAVAQLTARAADVAERVTERGFTDGTWVTQAAVKVSEATQERTDALRQLATLTFAATKALVDFS